jgi:phosphoribosylformimino-5-aminoimidazole carboxamide ribotide isomerase
VFQLLFQRAIQAAITTERFSMQVWPAIDLRGGKCVRLRQGDYERETVFAEDPSAVARQFVAQGAQHLHIVDLEGAREGLPVNLPSVQNILAAVDIECELGGGIRDEQSVCEILEFGVSRLVIGTSALTDPEWFRTACRKYPGKLVLGIDARHGFAATDGWMKQSNVTAIDLARQFANEPLAAIIYTDIATDGMMAGPNVAAMAQMQAAVDVPIIASGGVTTVEDVARLAAAGLAGCIIGRALYEGSLTIADALRAASGAPLNTTS